MFGVMLVPWMSLLFPTNLSASLQQWPFFSSNSSDGWLSCFLLFVVR